MEPMRSDFELIQSAFRYGFSGIRWMLENRQVQHCRPKGALDLRQITDVDNSGRQWLTEMLTEGTEYIVSSGFSEELAEELCLPATLSLPGSPQHGLLSWLKRWRGGSPASRHRKANRNLKVGRSR